MSGSSSAAAVTVAVEGVRPPFTSVQWQELEHQALIYKYLIAGLPVPSELLVPIRKSLEALPTRFLHHSALGYCSYYGKKFDPEPGRCRRTDGKKWRCSKDAYPDSKYCERHMHRGRNRSRKPVESQSTSQSLSTATSQTLASSSTGGGAFQSRGSGNFQNFPLYAEGLSYGTSKFPMQPSPYSLNNKEFRCFQGMNREADADEYNFLLEPSESAKGVGNESNIEKTWGLMPSKVQSGPLLVPKNSFYLYGNSTQLDLPQANELDAAMLKQRQQYCFLGNNEGSLGPQKEEQNSRRPFFDHEDDDGCNKNTFSTSQLSINVPVASSEYVTECTKEAGKKNNTKLYKIQCAALFFKWFCTRVSAFVLLES
ncbi:Growth-regulating factor [Heracleum sosnowskyi]|uniref:Growth-regulating factor n=1 Tax=Heracleum sosnowskyi TaxID=360622 RepID=A0AAD8I4K0_9APIA|nr:Growth-regulating factor [Heracleum sosnowskyi]